MNGEVYSEQRLKLMIAITTKYIDDPDLTKSIVSKCHQGIGYLLVGAPDHARAVEFTEIEAKAINAVVRRWRREKHQLKGQTSDEFAEVGTGLGTLP